MRQPSVLSQVLTSKCALSFTHEPFVHSLHRGYDHYYSISTSPPGLGPDINIIFTAVRGAMSPATLWGTNSFLFTIHHWRDTQRQKYIKLGNCRPHLPDRFGKVLQRVDHFFVAFSKGKVLDGARKGRRCVCKLKPSTAWCMDTANAAEGREGFPSHHFPGTRPEMLIKPLVGCNEFWASFIWSIHSRWLKMFTSCLDSAPSTQKYPRKVNSSTHPSYSAWFNGVAVLNTATSAGLFLFFVLF